MEGANFDWKGGGEGGGGSKAHPPPVRGILFCSTFPGKKTILDVNMTVYLRCIHTTYTYSVCVFCMLTVMLLRVLSHGRREELGRNPGGGVLGLEKGTNCSPTAAERWLSRHEMAKKGGLSSYYIVI